MVEIRLTASSGLATRPTTEDAEDAEVQPCPSTNRIVPPVLRVLRGWIVMVTRTIRGSERQSETDLSDPGRHVIRRQAEVRRARIGRKEPGVSAYVEQVEDVGAQRQLAAE